MKLLWQIPFLLIVWPLARLMEFFLWIIENPFAILYGTGFILWWNALYALGHHLDEYAHHDMTYLLCAVLFSMLASCFPCRLARVILAPAILTVELIFLFTGHHFLFYEVGAFFSTGYLFILHGEKIAVRRGVLTLRRPDSLDQILMEKLGVKPPPYPEQPVVNLPRMVSVPEYYENDPIEAVLAGMDKQM